MKIDSEFSHFGEVEKPLVQKFSLSRDTRICQNLDILNMAENWSEE